MKFLSTLLITSGGPIGLAIGSFFIFPEPNMAMIYGGVTTWLVSAAAIYPHMK